MKRLEGKGPKTISAEMLVEASADAILAATHETMVIVDWLVGASR
jgi:hypothetical protein